VEPGNDLPPPVEGSPASPQSPTGHPRNKQNGSEECPRSSLVELKDLRGILHAHTDQSDGGNSLEEMAEATRSKRLLPKCSGSSAISPRPSRSSGSMYCRPSAL
jgi:hypothetical protein